MAKYGSGKPLMGPSNCSSRLRGHRGEDEHHCITLLNDHPEGGGMLINPRSIFWMRVEMEELPWTDIHFESIANPI